MYEDVAQLLLEKFVLGFLNAMLLGASLEELIMLRVIYVKEFVVSILIHEGRTKYTTEEVDLQSNLRSGLLWRAVRAFQVDNLGLFSTCMSPLLNPASEISRAQSDV